MYQPVHFKEEDPLVQRALIEAHPLGLLISSGSAGIEANPLPFIFSALSGIAVLHAHLARANPQLLALAAAEEVLVVFQGAENYITPSWYPSKKEHGKIVPTWNYAIVQVRGRPRLIEDREWLHAHVSALTVRNEAALPEPWAVSDAPDDFIEGQLKGIVGLEIDITRIEAKWKVSQNRPVGDRAGVAAGIESGNPEMAGLVRAHIPKGKQ